MNRLLTVVFPVLILGLLIFIPLVLCRRRNKSRKSPSPKNFKKIIKPISKSLNQDESKMTLLSQPPQGGLDRVREDPEMKQTLEGNEESSAGKCSSTQCSSRYDEISPVLITKLGEKTEANKKSSSRNQKINQLLRNPPPNPGSEGSSEERFMRGEGLRAVIRGRQNPQSIQGEAHQARLQTRGEQDNNRANLMGTTRAAEPSRQNERQYDENGTEGLEELIDLNQIQQTKSRYSYKGEFIYEKERKKRIALEDLKKFNLTKIRVTKDGMRFQETCQKDVLELYKKFCEAAEVSCYRYYRENRDNVKSEGQKERIISLLNEDNFDTQGLKWTKDDLPYVNSAGGQIVFWLTRYGYYSKTRNV